MFCPSCGAEDSQGTQFCRNCGAELHSVRTALQRPDAVANATAANAGADAREEIGRAIAEKIRDLKDARGLRRIVEDVLPQVERFLETPEQKRLRRIREGIITGSVGVGLMLLMLLITIVTQVPQVLIACGPGLLVFFIGLGIAISGWLFSRDADNQKDRIAGSPDTVKGVVAGSSASAIKELSRISRDATEYETPIGALKTDPHLAPPSVTEVTTRTLAADKRRSSEGPT